MDLPAFIKSVGDDAAEKLFGVSARTIRSWRYGERKPKPQKALEIQRDTKGKVRFTDIYSEDRAA